MKELRREALHLRLSPYLALLTGLLLTTLIANLTQRTALKGAEKIFVELSKEIETAIRFRMRAYVSALLQTRGLFTVHGEPTPEQFRDYVATSDLLQVFPGLQGVGYSKYIPEPEQPGRTPRQDRTAIVMIEPLDWRNRRALGFDMFAEPTRRTAMAAARDTGAPTLSGVVRLVQETEQDVQPGFLLYVPVYRTGAPVDSVAERRRALLGYVYSPFRAGDLFGAIFRGEMHSELEPLEFEIYDGTAVDPQALLFQHAPSTRRPAGAPTLKQDLAFEVAGRPWLVHIRAQSEHARWVETRTPLYTWTAGGIASFLLFGLLHARRRVAAEQRSRRDRFLVDVNAVFDSPTDDPSVLDRLAEVAVPRFADWCFIATSSEEGVPSHIVVASSDTAAARRVHDRLIRRSNSGLLRSKATPELVERLSSAALIGLGLPPEDIALARELGFVSMIRLPLAVRGKIGGTITFVTADSKRRYGASDRATGEEIAERAATKLENARLLRRVQAANAERELILDSTADGIFGIDARGRAAFINPAAARMVGWKIEEIAGKQQHELLHHSHADGAPFSADDCPIYATLRDGTTHRSDTEVFWRKDGTSFPVEYASTPIFQGGEVTGAVVVFRDISERKRAEQELQRAMAAAESASKAKSSFLANMSHEIRTPLTAIMGFTQLMLDPTLDERERLAFAKTIERNGRLLMQIIDDILDLSKVEADKMTIEKLPCSLPRMIADVTALLELRAQEKGILLRIDAEPGTPEQIVSDPTRLKQILLNIVGNAVKFTQAGEVVVRIRKVERDGHPPQLAFVVEDTGRGIPAERHADLFQPFTQADSSTTRKFGGTGLGLVLSRRLAEALGGALELTESRSGVGSTFTITVPAEGASGRFGDVAATKRRVDLELPAPSRSKPLREVEVLLADDAPDNQLLMAQILRGSGASVSIAGNGEEAVRKALAGHYDVVLMDLQMPVKDGFEATAELRRRGYRRPIVAVSAAAMQEDRDRAIAAGCDDHLTKPVSLEGLVDKVAEITARPMAIMH